MKRLLALFLAAGLATTMAACGGGDAQDSTSGETLVGTNLKDPETPVSVDLTVAGYFEGATPTEVPDDLQPESEVAILYRDADSNQLSQADIDRAPEFSFEDFVAAYGQVRTAEPALSTSSDAFGRKLIDTLVARAATGDDTVRLLETAYEKAVRLTPAERNLVLINPLKALRTSETVDLARAATANLFAADPERHLTRADAFRHAYWNWLMSKCCSAAWAIAFATAHESAEANNDDKRMDLNNNLIGRRLFISQPGLTEAAAQEVLLNYPLLWINSKLKNVVVGVDYLVYLAPDQNMTVWDDGPDYDEIYTVSFAGSLLGDTPSGASRKFEFDQLSSGQHPVDVFCKTDGTRGGCGFSIRTEGALRVSSGEKRTDQITISEGGTHTETLRFPTMKEARVDE